MKIRNLVFTASFLIGGIMAAQNVLNNDSIVKMVKSGLGDGVIVSMVQSQPGNYTVTPEAMVALKKQGVSDAVLSAMALKGSAPAAAPTATPVADPMTSKYEDMDTGVYYKVKEDWTEIPSETVNWKTGGVLKSIASNGIVKGDVNGHINGGTSKTAVNTPLEFIIKAPDNSEATDFQLVHLHAKSDAREFRTMTGGVFHASGGATRDAIQFEQKKLAKHVYSVVLPPNLAPGEYAFLSPGLSNSTAAGSTGKAFTFRFVE